METTQSTPNLFHHYLHGLCTAFSRGAFGTGRFSLYPNGSRSKFGVQQKDMTVWDIQVIDYISEFLSKEPNTKITFGGHTDGIPISETYKTTDDPKLVLGWFRGLVDGYLSMSDEGGPLVFDVSEADSSQRMYINNVIQFYAKEMQIKAEVDKWSNPLLRGDNKFTMVWILYHMSTLFTFTTFPPAAVAVARLFNPFSSSLSVHPWAIFEVGTSSAKPELSTPTAIGPCINPTDLRLVDETKRIWAYETCPVSTKEGYYTELVVMNDVLGAAGWMPIRTPVYVDLVDKKVPVLTVVPFASWATDVPPPVADVQVTFVFHRKVHLTIAHRDSGQASPGANNNNSTMTALD